MNADIEIVGNARLRITANTDGIHIVAVGETFNSEDVTATISWDRIMEIEEFIFDDEDWE